MLKLISVEVADRDRFNETPVTTCGLCGVITYTWSCPLRVVDVGSGHELCPWHLPDDFADIEATRNMLAANRKAPGVLGLAFRISDLLLGQERRAEQKAANDRWIEQHPEEVAARKRWDDEWEAGAAQRAIDAKQFRKDDEIRRQMLKTMPNLLKVSE